MTLLRKACGIAYRKARRLPSRLAKLFSALRAKTRNHLADVYYTGRRKVSAAFTQWTRLPTHLNAAGANINARWASFRAQTGQKAHRWQSQSFENLIKIINFLGFHYYKFFSFFRFRKQVQSVLHLSIITHKPYMLSRLLREQGIRSKYLALNTDLSDRLAIGYDYHIPFYLSPQKRRLIEVFYLWFVLARYDVIHSHFKSLLSYSGFELPYLKKLGKILVFHFRGCDLRHRSLNLKMNPDLNCCQKCDYPIGSCDTKEQFSGINRCLAAGDLFFVTTPDLRDFLPEAEHVPFILPYGVAFDKVEPSARDPLKFRVVTSSNHHGIDGTQYIRDAIQKLSHEGHLIELIEVEKTPYMEALRIYKSADLFVGKLRMGYYNNANIETMLMGIPNMCYIRPEYLHKIPNCPIINTRPETVYENIKKYLERRDELKELGKQSADYVKSQHDPQKLTEHFIHRYNEAFRKKRVHFFARSLTSDPEPARRPSLFAIPPR